MVKFLNLISCNVIACLCLLAVESQALSRNIAEIKLTHAAKADVDTDVENDIQVQSTAFELKSIFAKQDVGDDVLLYRLRYEYREIDVSEPQIGTQELHNLAVSMEYIQRRDKWTHVYLLEPGIYSDLDSISSDDLGLTARYTSLYHASDDWDYLMGLGAGRQFGEPRFYPLLGAIYHPSENFVFSITFPAMGLSYQFNPEWIFYSYLKPIGSQWNVSNVVPLEAGFDAEGSVDFVAIGYQGVVGLERKVSKRLWCGFEIGQLFNQEYQFKDQGGNSFDIDIENRLTAAFSLKIRL
ncbi:MAG: hypothetical protein HRU20_21525 [Pseudomonadales bacterium]|nr:hypothetical protein [Pseudomonadales bacterium]